MLTLLLCRIERAPSWLEYVFVLETGSKEEAVEVEPLWAGGSIVATAISGRGPEPVRVGFDLSFALETRVGTSDLSEELIYLRIDGNMTVLVLQADGSQKL